MGNRASCQLITSCASWIPTCAGCIVTACTGEYRRSTPPVSLAHGCTCRQVWDPDGKMLGRKPAAECARAAGSQRLGAGLTAALSLARNAAHCQTAPRPPVPPQPACPPSFSSWFLSTERSRSRSRITRGNSARVVAANPLRSSMTSIWQRMPQPHPSRPFPRCPPHHCHHPRTLQLAATWCPRHGQFRRRRCTCA